jgi:putative hemolysin
LEALGSAPRLIRKYIGFPIRNQTARRGFVGEGPDHQPGESKVKRDSRRGQSPQFIRAAAATALLVLFVSGIAATSALGSTWTGRQLGGEAAKAMLFSVSCPSVSMCVAVGGNNTIASSGNPGGGQESWKAVYPGEGTFDLPDIPGLPDGGGFFNGRQIRGVSCPSTRLCVAVSYEGLVFTSTDPTGGADAWTVTDLDGSGPNTHLRGISCPTTTFCAAAAGKARIVTSTDPTGGASAWSVTQLTGPLELRGISCLSTALCVAVGDNGDGGESEPNDVGEILSSTDPLGGTWQRVDMPAGQGSMYGASCPVAALCVTGNLFGNLVTATNPTGPASAWTTTDGGGAVQITDVDCISATQCVAIDNNADVLTSTDPTGGPSAWTFTNMLPFPQVDETEANGTFGVSCPSTTFCAIAGAKGQIFTSADPFVVAPTPAKKGTGAGKGKKRPKRPRVTIARQPPGGIETEGSKVRARAFFYARKHVQVRGFSCKIDKRPARPCRSPRVFTVGIGKHVFRVRAIGWTGLKGPPEVARFKVCHPTTRSFCAGKPLPR